VSGLAALALAGCAGAPAAVQPAAAAMPPSEVVVMPALPAYICPNGRLMEIAEDRAAGTLELRNGSLDAVAFRAVGKASTYVAGELTIAVAPEALTVTAGTAASMTCPRRPQAPTPGIIWGMLDKRDRMALPEGSRARVLLADVSRMDVAAEEIAAATFTTVGNQVPLHFLIRYDPARILAGRTYTVSVRLEFPDGTLRYVTDTHTPVLADGPAPAPLELLLVPAGR
jgi:putative lipoprotein